LLHVGRFAHNKSGIAYRDGNQRSETVVNHKRGPTSSRGCYQVVPLEPGVPIEHPVQAGPASNMKCIRVDSSRKPGAGHRGWQLLNSVIYR
jgi:hypothetical protein